MGVVSGYPTIALYKGCRSSEKKPASPLGYWLTREADDLYRFVRSLLCPLTLFLMAQEASFSRCGYL